MNSRTGQLKEPWRAVFLNSFLPGLGEIYAGAPWRGFVFMAAALALAVLFAARCIALVYVPEVTVGFKAVGTVLTLALIGMLVYLGSLIDAYQCAKRSNKLNGLVLPPERKKSEWLSVTLSRFVPGLGQLYNGQVATAIIHGIAWLLILWTLRSSWLLLWAAALVLWSMRDAYNGAVRANGGGTAFRSQLRPWAFVLIACFIILCYLPSPIMANACLFRVHRITGGAMEPCLLAGDRVIVDTFFFRFTGIRRGDVAAFRCPDRPGRYYTKRIVGMPGETIEIRKGRIIINGKPLVTGGVIDTIAYRHYGTFCLPGQVVPIPEGCYFFLGDRLENSLDSRFYGPIPEGELLGRVVKIVRPINRARPVT